MRITVSLSIELDPKLWAEYNGITGAEVRKDVQTHVLHAVQQLYLLDEANASISLKTRP